MTLHNFLEFHHLDIRQVYKKGSWKRLCADAKVLIPDFNEPQEKELTSLPAKKTYSRQFSYLLEIH